MVDISLKDRKLLYYIESNARIPNTLLGKKIGLNSDVVGYKIKKLENKEILKQYIGYINFHKLGFIDFGIYISLKNLNHVKEKQFIEFIRDNENISYFSRTGGNYDFIVGILSRDPIELHSIIKEITQKYSGLIDQLDIVTRISLTHFSRKYLLSVENNNKQPYFGGTLSNFKIDELDHKILKILSENARERVMEISKKIKAPVSTVISRMKKLEKEEIITGYYALINPAKYNYQSYNLLIKASNLNEKEEKRLFEFCEKHPHITWLIKTLGQWDYEIGIEIENQEKLQEIIAELRGLSPLLTKIDFLAIFNTLKYSLYPFKTKIKK